MKLVNLINIADIEKGTEPGRKSYCSSEKGRRFLRVGDVTGKGYEEIYTNSNNVRLVDQKDILMTFDGTPGFVNRGLKGAISGGIRRIVPKDMKVLDRNYLYYALQIKEVKQTVKKYSAGQTIIHASKSIPNIKIPLPPLSEQKRIVEILEKADTLRKKRQEADELNNKIIQFMFLEMFGDPIKNNKKLELKAIESLAAPEKHAIKRGPFGGSLKKEIFVSSGYKVYEQKNVIRDDFNIGTYYITKKKFEEMRDFAIKPNDIIMSCSGTIGRITIVPANAQEGIINQALLKITLSKKIVLPVYFKFLFETESIQRYLFGFTCGSAIRNITSIRILKRIKLPIALLGNQQKFADLVQKVERIKEKQRESKKELDNLFNSLMQKMFG